VSPRPRKASDDEIFAATTRVMARCGPSELTLAMIASEAGLTAGALVQRFGSKRALLLALSERFATSTDQLFAGLRASAASPLAALRAYADGMAGLGTSATVLANNLSWLQQDLTDPDFRRYTQMQARAGRRELQRLVEEAIANRELEPGVDPAMLARAIQVTVGGSLMAWAIEQDGTCRAWVAHDLETLLEPHVVRRRKGRRGLRAR
jgi:AcrR family transcriptional regulator